MYTDLEHEQNKKMKKNNDDDDDDNDRSLTNYIPAHTNLSHLMHKHSDILSENTEWILMH
jgi:hypothetical protein